MIQIEIIEMKNTMTKIKSSMEGISRLDSIEELVRQEIS
jgi:hypothetical protein